MPQIKPTSVQDLLKFIEDHRSEIENRTYELIIESNWVPQISEDTLLFLIKHCPATHSVIASSMSTSLQVLEVFATRTGTVAVARMDIASNLNTASRVLEVLSRDTELVREAVASNPNTSSTVLDTLAKDEDRIVRKNVAFHRNTAKGVLKILSRDTCPGVR